MKVLVVVDLQTDFTFGVLGNTECAGVVEKDMLKIVILY